MPRVSITMSGIYLDEATGKQGKYFERMQRSLAKVLNAIVEVSAS